MRFSRSNVCWFVLALGGACILWSAGLDCNCLSNQALVGSSQSPLQGGSIKRPRRTMVTIFWHHCSEGLQSPTLQADGMDLVFAVEPDGQALCQFAGLSFG